MVHSLIMLSISKIARSSLSSSTFRVLGSVSQQQPWKAASCRQISLSNSLFEETPIKMPSLSPTMTAGTIVKWHKKPGDKIAAGDVLCEIQTDKAVMTFECDDDFVLAKILVNESSAEIPVGQLIAIVCGEEDDWQNVKVPEGVSQESSSSASSSTSPSQTKSSDAHSSQEASPVNGRMGPSARNLVEQYGIDLAQLKATGNRGFLLKEDVLKFVSEKNLKPKVAGEQQAQGSSSTPAARPSPAKSSAARSASYVDLEVTSMRRTIAKRLTESKSTIPHSYMSIRCEMDTVNELRTNLKNQNVKVSLNDMIVKAVGVALKLVPEVNCRWNAQAERVELVPNVDISIAVATPTGLITPIIHNANKLTLGEINATSSRLIGRAKEGKLQPDEFIGGSFSISNLGMFGIDSFTAVINPPQAAILAIGRTKQFFNTELGVESRMTIQLSYDPRAIDEEAAAKFMEVIRENLNTPANLLQSDGTSRRRLQSLYA